LLKTAKISIALFLLHVNHPQLIKRNIYDCIYVFWSLEVRDLC